MVDAEQRLVQSLRAEAAQPTQPRAHRGVVGQLRRHAESGVLVVVAPLVHLVRVRIRVRVRVRVNNTYY